MSTDDRPATTAARFERIDDKLDSLEQRVAAIEANQTHARELQTLQFAAFQKGQDTVLAKLESMDRGIAARELQIAQERADPQATPAGRTISATLTAQDLRIVAVERKFYMAMGAVALIAFLAPIVAPLIQAALGLPVP